MQTKCEQFTWILGKLAQRARVFCDGLSLAKRPFQDKEILSGDVAIIYENLMPKYERDIWQRRKIAQSKDYVYVGEFNEESFAIAKSKRSGYQVVDRNGTPAVPEFFHDLKAMPDGYFQYLLFAREGSSVNYFKPDETKSLASSKIFADNLCQGAKGYSEGLFCINYKVGTNWKAGKWGYFDINSNRVPKENFAEAYPFQGGYACVKRESDGHYELIDQNGRTVGAKSFSTEPIEISDGMWLATNRYGRKYFLGITHFGENSGFADFKKCTEGRIWAQDIEGWCCLDKLGKLQFEEHFDEAEPFSEGFAVVCKDGRWFFVDQSGKKAFDFETDDRDEINSFDEGVARIVKDSQEIYINHKGGRVFE